MSVQLEICSKMMDALSGEAILSFFCVSHLNGDQLLKKRVCSPRSKFFELREKKLWRALSSMEANRKLQKLPVFVRMAENLEAEPINFIQLITIHTPTSKYV